MEGVPVYMCGLEIAHEESIPRVKQLELADMKVCQENSRLQKIAEFMQKLIRYSSYSCTFDPVAAAVLVDTSFYTFTAMQLSCELEPPKEAQLNEVQNGGGKIHVGVKFEGIPYYNLLKEIITGQK